MPSPTSEHYILCQFGECDKDATIFDHGHWCEDHYYRAMDFYRTEKHSD